MDDTAGEVKRHGKHYTPVGLADFLAARVLSSLEPGSHLRVLDPACGDGELLLAIQRNAAAMSSDVTLDLVGFDLDAEAILAAETRATSVGVELSLHVGDFLEVARGLPRASFDAIITNPPYVRTQQLGQESAQRLASEFGLHGRIDLTHPFVSLCPQLLKRGGVVGLLCSNRFLTTRAGANVRAVLQTSLDVREVYDLGDTKLFEAAVLPAIVIASKGDDVTASWVRFASAYESATDEAQLRTTLFDALVSDSSSAIVHAGRTYSVRTGSLVKSLSAADPWRISHEGGDDWLTKISKGTWRTFGDVAKIRVGIKTTADSVFISNDWEGASIPPEPEILLPLVTHHNLTPWRISNHLPTRVLYPYDLTVAKRTVLDMALFPNAMAYLETHKERLGGRKYVIEGGRKWFEIWVPHKPAVWASPKIVFPDISERARFAIDRSGAVVNGDCYWISLPEIGDDDVALLMIAVANSSVGERFYDEVCGNKLYSGKRRWITQYVSRFPIPDPQSEYSRHVVEHVRRMLAGSSPVTEAEIAELNRLIELAFLDVTDGKDPTVREDATTLF